jgi:sugar lactone lactonase YvrE
MISIPSSICSTVRAAAIPFVFRNLPKRNYLPAWCGPLVLMLGGAWVGVPAQTAHFVGAESAVANPASNGLNGNGRYAVEGNKIGYISSAGNKRVSEETSSSGNFGPVHMRSESPTSISMIFAFDTAGTLGSTAVVTQGAKGLDFTDAGTGTCKAGTAYGTGETCTVDVSFTPKFAGTRYGAAKLLDGSGNLLATGYVQGTGVGPRMSFQPGSQSVVANLANNSLSDVEWIAVDSSGNVYIAEYGNDRVLKETPSAGGYTQSIIPINGPVYPLGIAVDGSGNLYVDGYTQVVKETLSAGGYTQSVVANDLNDSYDVAVDGSGNVYIADYGNSQVLKETLSADGYTESIVANYANNGLLDPFGVAVDGSGNVYISDSFNRVLKETLSAGSYTQSVIANAANGPFYPTGVAVDGSGNVYIADGIFGSNRVLKETPSAGGYTQSVVANAAINGLNGPVGVAVDGSGNVYVADELNNRVLKEDLSDPPSLPFAATAVGSTSTDNPETVLVSNDGNAVLIFPLPAMGANPSVPVNFDWDPSSTCQQTTPSSSAAFELAPGASCTMAFDFEPTATGSISGVAELTDNNLNVTGAVQGIQLTGLQGSQTINFSQLPSYVFYGVAPITLSATGGASGNPVVFSIVSGAAFLSGTNNSILNITGPGTVVIAANQAGDTDYAAAPTVTQSITVLFSATITSPARNSTLPGSSVTFTWAVGNFVNEFYLFLGSNGVGSNNLYSSGYTSHTSVNVTGLPVNGETIYARLFSFFDGAWTYLDYTYTAESLATLTSPVAGSTLTGSSETFTWSGGAGITLYYLFLGSDGVGSNNLYDSGYTIHNSVNVTGLPVNGETVYARLYWQVDGAWHHVDSTYTAE